MRYLHESISNLAESVNKVYVLLYPCQSQTYYFETAKRAFPNPNVTYKEIGHWVLGMRLAIDDDFMRWKMLVNKSKAFTNSRVQNSVSNGSQYRKSVLFENSPENTFICNIGPFFLTIVTCLIELTKESKYLLLYLLICLNHWEITTLLKIFHQY